MTTFEIEAIQLQVAAELAPGSWRRSIHRFSQSLGEGRLWVDAIALAKPPKALKNILIAVENCPAPISSFCDLMREKRRFKSFGKSILPMANPASLLVATFLLTSLTAWIGYTTTTHVDWVDWRIGKSHTIIPRLFLSQVTRSVAVASIVAWLILIALILHFLAARLTRLSIIIHIPCFGRSIRWSMFRDLLSTLSVLLRSGISSEKAAAALVDHYRSDLLEIPAQGIERRIQSGQTLEQAIRNSVLCDEYTGPAIAGLMRAQMQTPQMVQDVAKLANQLFEQRQASLNLTANRVGLLLVICMYLRFGVDTAIAVQGIDSSLTQFEFFGASENWFLLLPIAVVNFVFLNSMFHPSRLQNRTGIVSSVRLFAGTCLAIALIGLTLRCSLADLLYVFPISMAAVTLSKSSAALKRFAASQSLLSGAKGLATIENIASQLILENRGGARRRLRRFLKLIRQDVAFETAIAKSRLVADYHQRWLIGLIARFPHMEESKSILSLQSPWTDLSNQLLQRLNALKWMAVVLTTSILITVLFHFSFLIPMSSQLLQEGSLPPSAPSGGFPFEFPYAQEVGTFIAAEVSDPMTSPWGFPILFVCFGLLAMVAAIDSIAIFKRAWIDRWMVPIYKAWTLRGISEALVSDPRIIHVLNESSRIHPLAAYQSRLSKLVQNLEAGIGLPDAFAKSGMIRRSQQSLLALAKEPTQLAWSLRQIANRNFFRWIEWYLMLVDLVALMLIVATAWVAASAASALFRLLSSMIYVMA